MTVLPPLVPHWFVVYTYARSERKVHTSLVAKGLDSFLPLRKIHRRTDRDIEVPLLSNYVFVRTTSNHLATLANVPGVSFVVSFGGEPATVAHHEITAIRQSCHRFLQGKLGRQAVTIHKNVASAPTQDKPYPQSA